MDQPMKHDKHDHTQPERQVVTDQPDHTQHSMHEHSQHEEPMAPGPDRKSTRLNSSH